ncbi:MAG: SHD1 domain-containing protein [Thermoguttaceae bacterium]|jgi:hypothetical protein
MGYVLTGVIILLLCALFLGHKKNRKTDHARDPAALDRWKKSPTENVKRSRNPRVRYWVASIGKPIAIIYHEIPRTIRPIQVVRKPEYGKTYVLADENGEEKHFDIDDITFLVADSRAVRTRKRRRGSKALTALLLGGAALWGIHSCNAVHDEDEAAKRQGPNAALTAEKPNAAKRPAPGNGQRDSEPTAAEPKKSLIGPEVTVKETGPKPADMPTKKKRFRDSDYRKWTDSTGTYHVEAALAGQRGPAVTLEKRDGTQIKISVYRLSNSDRDWLQEQRDRAARR